MDLIGKQLPSVSASDNGKVLGVEMEHGGLSCLHLHHRPI